MDFYNRKLVIDPSLSDKQLEYVRRWERWPQEAAVLTALCAVLVIMQVGSLIMGDDHLIEIASWGLIGLFVIGWFIAMDHRVFRPVVVARRLKRQRSIMELKGGPTWDTFLREHRRIGNLQLDSERDRESLYRQLYLAIRDAARVEESMQLHENCKDDFDQAVHDGDLALRDATLKKITQEIDQYDV